MTTGDHHPHRVARPIAIAGQARLLPGVAACIALLMAHSAGRVRSPLNAPVTQNAATTSAEYKTTLTPKSSAGFWRCRGCEKRIVGPRLESVLYITTVTQNDKHVLHIGARAAARTKRSGSPEVGIRAGQEHLDRDRDQDHAHQSLDSDQAPGAKPLSHLAAEEYDD